MSEIAGYCSARISGADPETIVTGISTDSRKIRAGELFVALIGEKMDGHDYIGQARCAGAAAVLSSKEGDDPGTLYVEDTLRALADIAAGYRPPVRPSESNRHHRKRRQDDDQGNDCGRAFEIWPDAEDRRQF